MCLYLIIYVLEYVFVNTIPRRFIREWRPLLFLCLCLWFIKSSLISSCNCVNSLGLKVCILRVLNGSAVIINSLLLTYFYIIYYYYHMVAERGCDFVLMLSWHLMIILFHLIHHLGLENASIPGDRWSRFFCMIYHLAVFKYRVSLANAVLL